MIIFYSGNDGGIADPEVFFSFKIPIMLTYAESHKKKKPERRFRRFCRNKKEKMTDKKE